MRCYDGCPDSELKALMDANAETERKATLAGIRLTYFPVEEMWMAFRGVKIASEFHPTRQGAFMEAAA